MNQNGRFSRSDLQNSGNDATVTHCNASRSSKMFRLKKRRGPKTPVRARPPINKTYLEKSFPTTTSPLQRVLAKLEGVHKKPNGQFSACCPAHSDKKPSLSVKEDERGNVVLNCYSSCPHQKIVEALGLNDRDLRGRGHRTDIAIPSATSMSPVLAQETAASSQTTAGPCTIALKTGDAPGSSEAWSNRQQKYVKQLSDEFLNFLSDKLCVTVEPLKRLGLGYRSQSKVFTFPERNGDGQICGIATRTFEGTKRFLSGGNRGITIPGEMTFNAGDTLFLVEGPTDVAALTDMGLHAIGRPSNTGAVDQLVTYLTKLPPGVDVVVVGENDTKDRNWPGRDGAQQTAEKLAEALVRPIKWALVPTGTKDSRSWLKKNGADGNKLQHHLGRKFKRLLLKTAEAVCPQAWSRFSPFDAAAFAKQDFKRKCLVKDILVANEVAVIGGPKKSLKTTIAVDLAVSLATASPFLDKFEIFKQHRVGIFSGESGGATLQQVFHRVSKRTRDDVPLADMPLFWILDLPRLSDPSDLAALSIFIRRLQLEVVILDPLYLCLLAGNKAVDASNLYQMGPLLAAVVNACLQAGATPILVHHTKKSSNRGGGTDTTRSSRPMDLDDLSFSGAAEIARQWILISHRKPYTADGKHDLWMRVGGSAGHCGDYNLAIDEGQMDGNGDGRKFDVQVRTMAEVIDAENKEPKQSGSKKGQDASKRIIGALKAAKRQMLTLSDIKKKAHVSSQARELIDALIEEGVVEPCKITKRAGPAKNRPYDGYRLTRSRD